MNRLTEAGLEQSVAKDIVTRVIGDPRLMLGEVNSAADVRETSRVAYENFGQFDMESTDISEEEWDDLRRDLTDILLEHLRESYLDERIPAVDSTDHLYAILTRSSLSDEEIMRVVDAVVDDPVTIENPVDIEGPSPRTDADASTGGMAGFGHPGAGVEDLLEEDEGSNDNTSSTTQSNSRRGGGYRSLVDINELTHEDDDEDEDDDE